MHMVQFRSIVIFVIVGFTCLNGLVIKSGRSSKQSGRYCYKIHMAAASIVKKGKMKEVNELLQSIESAGPEHVVTKFLNDGSLAPMVISRPDFYSTVLSRTNTLSIIPEYNKKSKTGFILGLPPPEILGGVLRESGAKGIMVSMDKRSGGTTVHEFHKFNIEQSRSRKQTPGPIPTIWNDFIVDNIQIAQAAAYGAGAIILSLDLADNIKEQIDYARSKNVEPVVLIKTIDDALAALAAGARCLCMHTLEESAIVALKNQIPDTPGLVVGARLRPEMDFSTYAEIDTAWLLRDSGFSFVWPSPESVYSTGISEVYSTVHAMRSKASRVYMSPRQFLMDRKKEGAQEYLGDILY